MQETPETPSTVLCPAEFSDQVWSASIGEACKHAKILGWTIKFKVVKGNQSFADYAKKEIIVNSRHPLRVKYYILLHEMGHAIAMSEPGYLSPVEFHGPKYNTLIYRVQTVKDEFDAWDLGHALAVKNGWAMDEYFYVIRAKYISSYMIWASSRKVNRLNKKGFYPKVDLIKEEMK